MHAVVVGDAQVVVDGQIQHADILALHKRQRPAGGIHDADALDADVVAAQDEQRLVGAILVAGGALGVLLGRQLHLRVGRDDALGHVVEAVAAHVDGAFAIDVNIVAVHGVDQRVDAAHLVVVIAYEAVVGVVGRAAQDRALFQAERSSTQIDRAGDVLAAGDDHGLAARLAGRVEARWMASVHLVLATAPKSRMSKVFMLLVFLTGHRWR